MNTGEALPERVRASRTRGGRFSVCVCALALALPAEPGFRVTGSTPERVTFAWTLDSIDVSDAPSSSGTLAASVSFAGANCDIGNQGDPALPGFAFIVGAPPSGDVRVAISPQSVKRRELAAPVARRAGRDSGSVPPVFAAEWISEPAFGVMRGLRTARIVLRPVVAERSGRTVRILTAATGTIDLPPSLSPGVAPPSRGAGSAMMHRLVVNYGVAARWSAPPATPLRKTTAAVFPLSQGRMLTFVVGDGYEGMNAATTNENGLVLIPGSALTALGPGIRTSQVALHASVPGELPVRMAGSLSRIPDGVVSIPMLCLDRGAVGYVDAADTFLAYVTGSSDWYYDTAAVPPTCSYRLNRFGESRHYWVTAGVGNAMDTVRQPQAAPGDTVTAVTGHRFYTHPLAHPAGWEGGIDWVWRKLTASSPVFDCALGLVSPDSLASGAVRFTGFNATGATTIDLLSTDGTLHCASCIEDSWRNVPALGRQGTLRFQVGGPGNASYELRSLEVRYRQNLDMTGLDRLTVFADGAGGAAAYRVRNAPAGEVVVVRIPPDESAMSIIAPQRQGTSCAWSDSAGRGVRYYVCARSSARIISTLTQTDVPVNTGRRVTRLRSTANRSNYLIVTDSTFMSAAERLAAHKERYASFDSPVPRIVEIHDVYREFSGGSVDPAGVRNFLAWANAFWAEPLEYVMLLGNGHWDYLHTESTEPIFIPTFQNGSVCVEDYFASVGAGESWDGSPDIVLGRITCTRPEEAQAAVDKIVAVEDPAAADFGPWRTRVLLVADDDQQGDREDGLGDDHINASEGAARVITSANPGMDIRKAYLAEYPWDALWEKPEAGRAIVAEVNNGVSMVNYIGHGAPEVWADEHVLRVDNIGGMLNAPRYPLFTSFSCSVGRFDAPGMESLAEALLKHAAGGASACIAATRNSGSDDNALLGSSFLRAMFEDSGAAPLGSAYRQAMATSKRSSMYAFLGDPSLRFLSPEGNIRVSVLNARGAGIDSLQSLSPITVLCSVMTRGASPHLDETFGGTEPASIRFTIYNPDDTSFRKDGGSADYPSYLLPGRPVLSGSGTVTSGVYRQTVLIPRSVVFDKPGVRILAYAWEGRRCALGGRRDLVFHGSAIAGSGAADTTGPCITIRPIYTDPSRNAGATFGDRISVALPVEIGIGLSDESGVDVSGVNPDEGLTVEIAGVMGRRSVNEKFRFSNGDFRSGEAPVALEEGDLTPGQHLLSVTAQDLLGNLSKRTFKIEVVPGEEFSLKRVFNHPNPFRMGRETRFYFYATAPTYPFDHDGVRVAIRIYTLSGKLVRVLDSRESGVANGIAWDGTDQTGARLAPNVYLWRATAKQQPQGTVARSAIQKLVIHPPR